MIIFLIGSSGTCLCGANAACGSSADSCNINIIA